MTKFIVRSHNNQKAVLVDPSNYLHTLEITQKISNSRHGQGTVDSFRHTAVVRERIGVKTDASCKDDCSVLRDEAIRIEFVVAAGQPDSYYAAKSRQLQEAKAILAEAHLMLNKLKVGGELVKEFDVITAV